MIASKRRKLYKHSFVFFIYFLPTSILMPFTLPVSVEFSLSISVFSNRNVQLLPTEETGFAFTIKYRTWAHCSRLQLKRSNRFLTNRRTAAFSVPNRHWIFAEVKGGPSTGQLHSLKVHIVAHTHTHWFSPLRPCWLLNFGSHFIILKTLLKVWVGAVRMVEGGIWEIRWKLFRSLWGGLQHSR